MSNVEGASGTVTPLAEKSNQQRLYRLAWLVFLLVVALCYLWQAIVLPPLPRIVRPSPHLFPILIGLLMVVSAGVLVIKGAVDFRRRQSPAGQATVEDDDYEPVRPGGKRDLAATMAMLCLYVIAIAPFGFYISSAVLLFSLSSYFTPMKWRRNLLASLLIVAFVFLIFQLALNIGLPTGTIW